MIHDTIERIEKEIQDNINSDEQKKELLELLEHLKVEIESINRNSYDDARSIAKFTESGIIEATREFRNEDLFKHAISGMQLSVRQFEVSHPNLIAIVNSICNTLTNIGI